MACPNAVHGNSCDICPSDVVISATSLTLDEPAVFDPTVTTLSSDPCPEIFLVEVRDADQLPSRGAIALRGQAVPSELVQSLCERPYELSYQRSDGAGFTTVQDLTGTGRYHGCGGGGVCVEECAGVPLVQLGVPDLTNIPPIRFGTPSDDATKQISIVASSRIIVR